MYVPRKKKYATHTHCKIVFMGNLHLIIDYIIVKISEIFFCFCLVIHSKDLYLGLLINESFIIYNATLYLHLALRVALILIYLLITYSGTNV